MTDDDDSRRAGEAVASTGPAAASSEPAGAGSAVACACGTTAARTGGLQINLIMTDRTLLAGDQEPAILTGHGPIPAPLARAWALGIGHADTGTRSWVQRPYRPRHQPTRRHGLQEKTLSRRGATIFDGLGPNLPHPVV